MVAKYVSFLASHYRTTITALSPLYESFLNLDRSNKPSLIDSKKLLNVPQPALESFSCTDLLIFLTNARSLVCKMDALKAYALLYNPHVICVTETWGTPDLPDSFFSLNGYRLYRCDRESGRGGGVLTYVKETLFSRNFTCFSSEGCEVITCKISLGTDDILIACVYRPPSHVLFNSALITYLYQVSQTASPLVICGDFNCPDIDWITLSRPESFSPLLEWAMNNFLVQHVSSPTRPASSSLLDLVFSPISTKVTNVNVNDCFDSSDHAVVTFTVDVPVLFRYRETDRHLLFHKAKWSIFRSCLLNSHWDYSKDCHVDFVWNQCLENLRSASKKSIPCGPRKPWTPTNSSRVRTALRYCRRYLAVYNNDPSFVNLMFYRRSQSILRCAISKVTASYERIIVTGRKSLPKLFWSYVNNKIKYRLPFSSMRDVDGDAVYDPFLMAESFNDAFSSNFVDSSNESCVSTMLTRVYNLGTLSGFTFTLPMVLNVIKKLPSSTGLDPDGLCYLHLKKGGMFLASKLTDLFNLSLLSSRIPFSWRNIVITPVHKNGSRESFSNYRPIAVTSVVCRVMERIMVSVMLDYISTSNVISPSQHGFLPKRSVETAGLVFYSFLLKNLDLGKNVDVLLLDFAKAFEKVPHGLLVQKLYSYGFRDPLLGWISDFLKDRTQTVRINSILSNPRCVMSGVIQGSVLGPLLFSLFINDLDAHVFRSFLVKYADDVKLSIAFDRCAHSHLSCRVELQDDLNRIEQWSISNHLPLNVKKCQFISFGTSFSDSFSYVLGGCPLVESHFVKDLGVLISSPVSFKNHVASVVSRANRMLGLLKRIFSMNDQDNLVLLYKCYVRPLLEFASILWCPHQQYIVVQLEKVQKRFTKFFATLRDLPYRERLKSLNLLSLEARRLRYKMIFLFKMMNNLVDLDPESLFTFSRDNRTRGNKCKIVLQFARTNTWAHFFPNVVANHWNNLSDDDISVSDVNAFKRCISRYFMRVDIW